MNLRKTAAVFAMLCTMAAGVCASAATVQDGCTISFDTAADCCVASAYSENGELVGIQCFDEQTGELDYNKITADKYGSMSVKVMSWDKSTLEPVTGVIKNNIVSINKENIYSATDSSAAAEEIIKNKTISVITEYDTIEKYKFDDNAVLYVNGKQVDMTAYTIEAFIVSNKAAKLTLADTNADGVYDILYADCYKSALVSDVMSNGKIYFDVMEYGLDSGTNLADLESCSILLDGEEIQYSDLQKGDVLSIAYDVTDDFADTAFMKIFVSRNAVKGVIEAEDTSKCTYTVNGEEYRYDEYILPFGYMDDAVGADITMYIDVFGRVVLLEESINTNCAILENVWLNYAEDEYYARLVLSTGESADYVLKDGYDDADSLMKLVFVNGDKDDGKNDITERVISYKVNSLNQIHSIISVSGKYALKEEYIQRTNKIGTVKLSNETKILNCSEYTGKVNDIYSVKQADLRNGCKYTVCAYNKLASGEYAFVIITDESAYSDYTQIAVFNGISSAMDEYGDYSKCINVFYENKERQYFFDEENESKLDILNKGDVIVMNISYRTDMVDDFNVIAQMGFYSGELRNDYDSMMNIKPERIREWDPHINIDTCVELDFGRIIDKTKNCFTLTTAGEEGTSYSDEREYNITEDTKVYVLSYAEVGNRNVYVGSLSDIKKTSIPSSAREDEDYIDWTNSYLQTNTNFAFVKAVDGEAEQVVVVLHG